MNSTAPFKELGGDPRTAPYSFTVFDEEARQKLYGSIPHNDTPFENTPLNGLYDIPDIDQIGILELATYLNHRLLPKLWQADKALRDIEPHINARNERARKNNEQVTARLEGLEKVKDGLLKQRIERDTKYLEKRQAAVAQFAKSASQIGLVIEAENLSVQIPPKEVLMDIAAHAAKEKLPYCPIENDLFWSPSAEIVLLGLIGTALGLSIGATSGMIHLNMIAKEPVPAILWSSVGIGIAMYVGRGIKALWRATSEEYYLGNPWRLSAGKALLLTSGLFALETAIHVNGLMALRGLHASVQALSGRTSNASDSGFILLVLSAAILSASYSIYMAISGWRKNRAAAANRITLSVEQERLEHVKEIQATDGWKETVAGSNALIALEVTRAEANEVFSDQSKAIATREKELRSHLIEIAHQPNETECAILDRAITELEGAQSQFDARLLALRQGKVHKPSYKDHGHSSKRGLWARISGLFKPLNRAKEGI